jgi:hypothetical protein
LRDSEPKFLSFVRAVHRRVVVVRAVERAGVCAAIAAGFALVFTGTMLWRGDNGFPLAIGTILLGGVIGLLWGLAQRPEIADAALAADRQLQLADLLATALSLVSNQDPWARAVVATAEQRCRTLSADAIVVGRLGGRAWGGIGLAAALVMTVGALSALPGESPAGDAKRGHPEYPAPRPANSQSAQRDILDAPFSRADRKTMPGTSANGQGDDAMASSGSPPRAAPATLPSQTAGTGTTAGTTVSPAHERPASSAAATGKPSGGTITASGGGTTEQTAAGTSTDPAGRVTASQAGEARRLRGKARRGIRIARTRCGRSGRPSASAVP